MEPPPEVQLNCPYCGAPIVYEWTQDDVHFYRCARDGVLVLPPHGRIRREDPDNPPVDRRRLAKIKPGYTPD